MHIVHLDKVTVNYGGRIIFRDLSWAIGDRDRAGLVGPNGAGKSSILKLLAGAQAPDAGHVSRMKGVTVGYLPQEVAHADGLALREVAATLPPELARVESDLARVETQLGEPEVYNSPDRLARVLERQAALLEEFDRRGGNRHASRVREILSVLGFTPDDYDLPASSLSGGQKKLIALARLALEMPDVLLLDEPDNHLDLNAKRRLEAFIRQYPGAVIIVSHDRYLLDEIADQIVELEDGKLTIYPGNYSAYSAEREARRLRQQRAYVTQQKEIARIEAMIKQFELWAKTTEDERHARQARSKRKMLDRMEANGEIIDAVRERKDMALQLDGGRGSTNAIKVERLSMGFGDRLLFVDLNFVIRHGERVGLIAPNGAGKSVLFKLILGQITPLEGEVKIGPSTMVGDYAQEHQTLSAWLDRTPIEMIRDIWPRSEGDAMAFLAKFLFSYAQATGPISNLSGGERSRLQLARLMLARPNVLLLDEPTNNLDIASAEALEAALDDFEGAVFVISHDRYFLDRVVDRVLALNDGALQRFEGGYTDYLAAEKIG